MTDGVPDAIQDAAEWAHDALGDERLDWLRRLPSERRWRADDDTLVLVCHALAGFADGRASTGTWTRRSPRSGSPGPTPGSSCCGHTHLPEVRDFGWKVIVNDGSAGYVFDGDPTASWALIDIAGGDVTARARAGPSSTCSTVANAISARGLAGDVYRAATVRTGKLVR